MLGLWSAESVYICALQTTDMQTTDWVEVCLSVQYIYTLYSEQGMASHDMGSLLHASRGHASNRNSTAFKAPGGQRSKH